MTLEEATQLLRDAVADGTAETYRDENVLRVYAGSPFEDGVPYVDQDDMVGIDVPALRLLGRVAGLHNELAPQAR